jgi:tetrahydromethanopterin S-methyltransferase subunit G
MEKIFIVVIILVLVGCQPKNEMQVVQVDNTEVLEQLDALDNSLDTTFHEMYLDFQEMKDRLDEIEDGISNKEEYIEYVGYWFQFFLNGDYDEFLSKGKEMWYEEDTQSFCYTTTGDDYNCETIEEDMG